MYPGSWRSSHASPCEAKAPRSTALETDPSLNDAVDVRRRPAGTPHNSRGSLRRRRHALAARGARLLRLRLDEADEDEGPVADSCTAATSSGVPDASR